MPPFQLPPLARHTLLLSTLALAACGGSGSDPLYPPSAQRAQQCAPSNTYAPQPRTGSLTTEKQWIRSYFNEAYLWYDEIPNVNANDPIFTNSYAPYSLNQYFNALRVSSKDRFSFTYPTADWLKLSGSGVQAGYGIEWVASSQVPPRGIRIAYVQPNSPAATSGLRRGDVLLSADTASADAAAGSSDNETRLDAMFPPSPGETHSFVFSRSGSANVSVSLSSADVSMTPVPIDKVITANDGKKVGYLLFHDHVLPAEAQLIAAFGRFQAAQIDDLVIDLRYNGGGYIFLASQLAYMVAGPTRTANKAFERYQYNAKRGADAGLGFLPQACLPGANFECSTSSALPALSLPTPRVYVITRAGTCSASEALINGLRGVGITVHQIGSTTCGKPYGFSAKDNCGISYFPIEFKGVNELGFGDYASGFTPGGTGPTGLPGCQVADDLSQALGDEREGMLAATLAYRSSGSCPAAPTTGLAKAQGLRSAEAPETMLRSPLRDNRFVLPN